MKISENLITIGEYTGVGYKPVVDFESWRVAVLNYIDDLLPQSLATMQRHLLTDEVFVLLKGKCILFVADGDQNVGTIEAVNLEAGKLYNVKKAVWHTHTLSRDAMVLVIENRDTTLANSPKKELLANERSKIISLVNTLWNIS